MARGDLAGYPTAPAVEAVAAAVRAAKLSPDGLKAAIDFTARQPGAKAQALLADVVLDAKYGPEVRTEAARELIRHVQKHSVVLPAAQVQLLRDLYAAETDKSLKTTLGQLQGGLRPDARTTGERLLKQPLPDTAPPKDAPAKDAPPPKDK
jgi:hypothetical protein